MNTRMMSARLIPIKIAMTQNNARCARRATSTCSGVGSFMVGNVSGTIEFAQSKILNAIASRPLYFHDKIEIQRRPCLTRPFNE